VKIITGFDGACPQSDEAVLQLSGNRFEIRPSWRGAKETFSEERPGEGFSFCVKVAVEGAPVEGELVVNWEDASGHWMHLRDYVSVRLPGEDDWRIEPAPVEGPCSTVHMTFPAGETWVALCPLYNVAQAEAYLEKKAARPLASLDEIGKSNEGRPLRRLRVTSERGAREKANVVVLARTHPYESAGSYASEGAIDFLLSGSDVAGYLLSRFAFHFVPMPNPDAVARGLSRLTAPAGHNLARVHDGSPPENRAIRAMLDELRPHTFIDLHNWLDKRKDAMMVTRLSTSRHLLRSWPAMDGKYWRVLNPQEELDRYGTETVPKERHSWRHYCRDKFGSDATTFEFPWFARSTRRMREIGAAMLPAYLVR